MHRNYKGLGAVALVLAMAMMLGLWASGSNQTNAQVPPDETIAAPASAAIGGNFSVTVSIDSGATAFNTYQVEVAVPAGTSFVSATHNATGTFPSCFAWPGPTAGPTTPNTACGHAPPDAAFTGLAETLTLSCDVAGPHVIGLVDGTTDPINGSYLIDSLGPVATNIGPAVTTTCVASSDIQTSKSASSAGNAAGSVFTYTVVARNAGPQPAVGLVVADPLPDIADGGGYGMKTLAGAVTIGLDTNGDSIPEIGPFPACIPGFFGSYANPLPPPAFFNSMVLCSMPLAVSLGGMPAIFNAVPAGDAIIVTLPVKGPYAEEGAHNVNVSQSVLDCGPAHGGTPLGDANCTTDPNGANEADCAALPLPAGTHNVGCAVTLTLPANVTISKVGSPASAKDGDTITWTTTVAVAAGGSAAANPLGEGGVGPATTCWDNIDNNGDTTKDVDGGAVGGTPDPTCADRGPVLTDNVDNATTSAVTGATVSAGTCLETGTNAAQIVDATGQSAVDVKCSLSAPVAAGSSVNLIVLSTAKSPNVTSCANTSTITFADLSSPALSPKSATGTVACQPKGVVNHLDKGTAVFPQVIDVLVGSHGSVIVTETLEIVTPGPTPNLVHTWIANSPAGDGVSVLWRAGVAGDVITPSGGPPGSDTQTVDSFQTSGHVPGLITIQRTLDVYCTSFAGNETPVNLVLQSTGAVTRVSPAQLIVQCFNSPQEVKVPAVANLWLMRHPNCGPNNLLPPCFPGLGLGSLIIQEQGSAIANGHGDPGGLGAYEKQIKYDSDLFTLKVFDGAWDGVSSPDDAADYVSFLGSTGRTVNCTMTIITENWIDFGCVSTGTMDGPTATGPVTLTTILVEPKPDLFLRLHPTKNNGVVSNIIDENCEWADAFGNPMAGSVNGGQIPVCTGSTITIRMLEGDLNNDCNVDVLDEQNIASRYGATFGSLLYNGYYDLQPTTGDFDIDIKDLQFVFGRDGSTCNNPIPAQPPATSP